MAATTHDCAINNSQDWGAGALFPQRIEITRRAVRFLSLYAPDKAEIGRRAS